MEVDRCKLFRAKPLCATARWIANGATLYARRQAAQERRDEGRQAIYLSLRPNTVVLCLQPSKTHPMVLTEWCDMQFSTRDVYEIKAALCKTKSQIAQLRAAQLPHLVPQH